MKDFYIKSLHGKCCRVMKWAKYHHHPVLVFRAVLNWRGGELIALYT